MPERQGRYVPAAAFLQLQILHFQLPFCDISGCKPRNPAKSIAASDLWHTIL